MLRREGRSVSGEQVRRRMAEMGPQGKAAARRRTIDRRHRFPRSPDLVEGRAVTRPDHV